MGVFGCTKLVSEHRVLTAERFADAQLPLWTASRHAWAAAVSKICVPLVSTESVGPPAPQSNRSPAAARTQTLLESTTEQLARKAQ